MSGATARQASRPVKQTNSTKGIINVRMSLVGSSYEIDLYPMLMSRFVTFMQSKLDHSMFSMTGSVYSIYLDVDDHANFTILLGQIKTGKYPMAIVGLLCKKF